MPLKGDFKMHKLHEASSSVAVPPAATMSKCRGEGGEQSMMLAFFLVLGADWCCLGDYAWL